MAEVVTFWWHPEEEVEFIDFLETLGPTMAMPFDRASSKDDLSPRPIRESLNRVESLFVTRRQDALACVVRAFEIDGETFFRVSDMESCVIGYDRARFSSDGALSPGNLNFYRQYPNTTVTGFVEKSKDFVDWARKVLKWVRKSASERVLDLRGSKRIKTAVQEGSIKLAHY